MHTAEVDFFSTTSSVLYVDTELLCLKAIDMEDKNYKHNNSVTSQDISICLL